MQRTRIGRYKMTQVNELSAKMLREAAGFFLKISQDNPAAQADMANNADTYYKMAELIEKDPQGATEHLTHAEMAARLLGDAAIFFRSVGETNPPIAEQMSHNADVFDELAAMLRADPVKVVEG